MWAMMRMAVCRAFSTRPVAHSVRQASSLSSTQSTPLSPLLTTPQRSLCRSLVQSASQLFQTADDDNDDSTTNEKNVDSAWNIPGLKKEVQRMILRSHKKIGKASTKLRQAQERVDYLTSSEDATQDELENCPNLDAIADELQQLQDRLQGLNQLEETFLTIKKKESTLDPATAQLALDLGVNDQPPARPPRGPGKAKGPRTMAPRKPFRRYFSKNQIEIRVGKQAEDNDELSLNPEHRSGADWWMHASGCPGSHVVICCQDASLPEQVIQDAASLAALQSKCTGSVVAVSLTRCRQVSKPPGAKAGLVRLNGEVRTVKVKRTEAQERFQRLEQTVLIN